MSPNFVPAHMGSSSTASAPRFVQLSIWLKRWSRWLIAAVLVDFALVHATSLIWTSDDAFASYRYAENWAKGLGLVFNANERVEGITNPLWTILLGVVCRSGGNIEDAAILLGLAAYLGSILILSVATPLPTRTNQGVPYLVPIAGLIGAANVDWATFATGGLETSMFTFTALAAYAAAFWFSSARWAGFVSGVLIAVTAMVRPDGALFVPALALAFATRMRRPGLLIYAIAATLVLAPFHGWRRYYYGDWLPNTYHAKSAMVSWWGQGVVYLGYFAQRHALVIVVTMVAFGVWIVRTRPWRSTHRAQAAVLGDSAILHRLATASAMLGIYTLSVVKVGGDFMYARLLVPVIPFMALALESSLGLAWGNCPRARGLIGSCAATGMFLTPCPVDTVIGSHYGIVDERAYYQGGYVELVEARATILRECLSGYPVRVAIYGGELRMAYRAKLPFALEAHAGLTDRTIARQPLTRRRRVGHEKSADAAYLVTTRSIHFATSASYATLSDREQYIPNVHANLCGVDVRLLHWDPKFVEFVRAQGATVEDYPRSLDRVISQLDFMADEAVRKHWTMAQHFYFAYNPDARRAASFATRLQRLSP